MSTILKSGLYISTFSYSTIMNKNQQVGHSKQETISVILTPHPSSNTFAPQHIVWLIWPKRKFQKIIVILRVIKRCW